MNKNIKAADKKIKKQYAKYVKTVLKEQKNCKHIEAYSGCTGISLTRICKSCGYSESVPAVSGSWGETNFSESTFENLPWMFNSVQHKKYCKPLTFGSYFL